MEKLCARVNEREIEQFFFTEEFPRD
jgi:hypothetical protein